MDDDEIGKINDKLAGYVQRNVSFEIQKALAINIVVTAITKWQCGIIEATKRAADCCGFNAETVRRWISTFVSNVSTCSLDEMNDDCITDMLSSSRGMHDEHSASLLHDENFCFSARQYVRKNACKKGEPNLTSQMFAQWIKTEYGLVVHEVTACKWLAKLGFSRIHHQKGVYFDGHDTADVVEYRDIF